MGYITQNKRAHDLAWELDVAWNVREWAAWYYISELMRRHPHLFTPVPRFTMQKELMDMETSSAEESLMIRVNRTGNVVVWGKRDHPERCPIDEGAEPGTEQLVNLLDVYLHPNPREIIQEIELCAGLTPPRATPHTGSVTIGPRVIAELIRTRLHSDRPIVPSGVFQSSEYGDSIDKSVLQNFEGLRELANLEYREVWHSIYEHPVPLYSGLFAIYELPGRNTHLSEPGSKLLFIVDIKTGILYKSESQIDLMKAYSDNHRDIHATAASILYR